MPHQLQRTYIPPALIVQSITMSESSPYSESDNLVMSPTSTGKDSVKAILQQRLQQRLQKQTENDSSILSSPTNQYPFANFQRPQRIEDFPESLQSTLPLEFSYILDSYSPLPGEEFSFPNAPTHFYEATLHVSLTTIEQAQQWLAAFERRTGTSMRVSQALKTDGKLTLWHRKYHCCHANLAEVKSYPHKKERGEAAAGGRSRLHCTGCKARMSIHLKRVRATPLGSGENYPCKVRITMDHNHSLHSGDDHRSYRTVLGKRKPTSDNIEIDTTSTLISNDESAPPPSQRVCLVSPLTSPMAYPTSTTPSPQTSPSSTWSSPDLSHLATLDDTLARWRRFYELMEVELQFGSPELLLAVEDFMDAFLRAEQNGGEQGLLELLRNVNVESRHDDSVGIGIIQRHLNAVGDIEIRNLFANELAETAHILGDSSQLNNF